MTSTNHQHEAKNQALHAAIRAAAAQALHIHDSYGSLGMLEKPDQLGLSLVEAGYTVSVTIVKRS